ncbi:MAG TPA: hypothetical protein VKR54_02765 [Candidatus Babeliales bacterium]|nr:hypothetical protein [Candidatus Babeliales bacterium]
MQTPALPLGYAATYNSIIYHHKVNILNVAENSYTASFLPPIQPSSWINNKKNTPFHNNDTAFKTNAASLLSF